MSGMRLFLVLSYSTSVFYHPSQPHHRESADTWQRVGLGRTYVFIRAGRFSPMLSREGTCEQRSEHLSEQGQQQKQ